MDIFDIQYIYLLFTDIKLTSQILIHTGILAILNGTLQLLMQCPAMPIAIGGICDENRLQDDPKCYIYRLRSCIECIEWLSSLVLKYTYFMISSIVFSSVETNSKKPTLKYKSFSIICALINFQHIFIK